jgi:arylsulfatase A-like enzyme
MEITMSTNSYTRRDFLKTVGLTVTAAAFSGCSKEALPTKPNFVLIFTDDQGYSDVGCYGAEGFKTPNLDRMADEGMKFTDFYVGASICSPSRAALLTGCYPPRVSMIRVLFPLDKVGLNPKETTIANVLKTQGYATACIGKWHLGHLPQFLPTQQGFDYFFGLPYSNDMLPEVSTRYPPLALIEGQEPIELDPDQSQLTRRYTEKAVEFIKQNKDKPFFVYLPHTMPHIPLYASEKFAGKSGSGIYGDVMEELDWSTGEILNTLKELNLDERTVVIFTSDNGPWLSKKEHGGSARPLRDGKFSSYEGGLRVPCIMRWPGIIPAGTVCSEIASTIDLLPTFAKLAGAEGPSERIDGKDISALMKDPQTASPHEAFFYYNIKKLDAVRSGDWKLVYANSQFDPPALYNLKEDISEEKDVSSDHPDQVQRLSKLADTMRQDLGDLRRDIRGTNIRPRGEL